jgi:hypothetical protein
MVEVVEVVVVVVLLLLLLAVLVGLASLVCGGKLRSGGVMQMRCPICC